MNRKKSILLVTMVALLLTFAVGGTVAYLFTQTKSITNTFTPTTPGVDVEDKVEGNVKKDVVVTNTSDFDAYIRVAVVANWCNENGEIVEAWNDYGSLGVSSSEWVRIDDYYYHKAPVKAGDKVTLFTNYDAGKAPVDGAHLVMDIVAQCIQAKPTSAVTDTWKVTVDGSGNITGGSN